MAAPILIGCCYTGSVFAIDMITGSGTLVGNTGLGSLNSLAYDGNWCYSVAPRGIVGPTPIIRIDPITFVGGLIGPPELDLNPPSDIRGLAFSSTGVLFGVRNGGGPTGTELPGDLVTINVSTGAVTSVGNTTITGIQAIAFAPFGTRALYGWSRAFGLLTIDTTSGLATPVQKDPPTASPFDIQGLAFAAGHEMLFGAPDSLFLLDPTSGVPTLIGSGGYSDLRGLAFVPPPHPFKFTTTAHGKA